jgi:hypothetical protein
MTIGADMSLEYALNAVNQGVTSLGIKGSLSPLINQML